VTRTCEQLPCNDAKGVGVCRLGPAIIHHLRGPEARGASHLQQQQQQQQQQCYKQQQTTTLREYTLLYSQTKRQKPCRLQPVLLRDVLLPVIICEAKLPNSKQL
jgi:hypothetical protein